MKTKKCPKCFSHIENVEREYCRPCRENQDEFVRLEDIKETCFSCSNELKTDLELKKNECTYCYVQRKT